MTNTIPYLNLDLTIESGQVFLWNKINDYWYGVDRNNIIKVSKNRKDLEYSSYPESVDCKRIFGLEDDLNHIYREVSKDTVMEDALAKMRGLRIMRQDPYQCLISFICATNTSISMIKRMLTSMSMKFGKKIEYNGVSFHAFPEPKELAEASINELCRCSVGYRAPFIRKAAKTMLTKEVDFDYLKHVNYDRAKKDLMDVLGVGEKVADCILLFSLQKLESFPIDVWIARAIRKYYSQMFEKKLESEKITPKVYRMISSKMRGYFGAYAGYAQQYLYCYARNNGS
ncbi:MAG: DNA-3-methyladenine glycosylase family protein [Nitrososphaerales archaeon]